MGRNFQPTVYNKIYYTNVIRIRDNNKRRLLLFNSNTSINIRDMYVLGRQSVMSSQHVAYK